MATELTGTLKVNAAPFLTGLRSALQQGARSLQQFIQGPGHASVKVDTGQASGDLSRFQSLAQRIASGIRESLSNIRARINTDDAEDDLEGLKKKVDGAGEGGLLGGLASKAGLVGIAVGLGAIVKEGVGANAEMETFETQLGTLIKGTADFKEKYKNVTDPLELQARAAEEAKVRLAELNKFGAETPFELPQLAQAEKVLLGFGLTGQRALQLTGKSAADLRTIIGDVSAGVGVDFGELAVTFGKFSTGATGEAIARLQELGIVTKEELRGMGVEFDKAGSLVSPVPQALTAAITIAQQKFGGGMAQLSQTFEGRMSTLADIAKQGAAAITGPIFQIVGSAVEKLNAVLSSDSFQKTLTSIGDAIGPIASIIIDTLGSLIGPLSQIIGPLAAALTAILVPLSGIIGSIVTQLGGLITQLAGPIGAILNLASSLVTAILTPLQSVIDKVFPILLSALTPVLTAFEGIATAVLPLVDSIGQLLAVVLPLLVSLTPMVLLFQVLTPLWQSLAPIVVQIVTQISELATVLISALMPILQVVLGLVGGLANMLSKVLGGAVSFVAGLIGDLVSGTLGLLIDALELVGVTVEDTTQKEINNAKAQEKSIQAQRDATTAAQDRARNTRTLAAEFETLSQKQNRSVEEEKRLASVQLQLNQQYPGLISNTKSFGENIKAVQGVARDATLELGKLSAEMARLDVEARGVAARQASLQSTLAAKKLREVIADAADGDAALEFMKAFGNAINDAQTASDVQAAFGRAAKAAFSLKDVDLEGQNNIQTALNNLLEARLRVVELLQKPVPAPSSAPIAPESSQSPPPDSGKDTKTKVKEIASAFEFVQKTQEETTQLAARREAKALDDALARIHAEAEAKADEIRTDLQGKANAEKTKLDEAAKSLKQGEALQIKGFKSIADAKVAIDGAADRAIQERSAQVRDDELKAVKDFLQKANDERLKSESDLLKKREEAITENDEASIRRRAELQVRQTELSLQAQIDTITRSLPTFRNAARQIDEQFLAGDIDPTAYTEKIQRALVAARPDLSSFLAGLSSVGKELLDGTIDANEYRRKVQEVVATALSAVGDNAELSAAVARLGADATKNTLSQSQAIADERRRIEENRIASITNDERRALEQSMFDARRAYDDRQTMLDEAEADARQLRQRNIISENELNVRLNDIGESRAQAELDRDKRIFEARAQFYRQTNILVAGAFAFREALSKIEIAREDKQARDRLNKRLAEIATEKQTLREKLDAGTINIREFNSESKRLDQEREKALEESGLRVLSTLQRIQKAAGQALQSIADTFAQRTQEAITRLSDGTGTLGSVVANAAATLGATFGAAMSDLNKFGEEGAKRMLTVAFKFLQSLIPILSAQILGYSLATPDAILTLGAAAFAKWAILTGLLSAAVAGVGAALKLRDGISRVPGNPADGDSVPTVLQPGERVVRERDNRRWWDILEVIHRGGDPYRYAVQEVMQNANGRALMRVLQPPRAFPIPILDPVRERVAAQQTAETHALATAAIEQGRMLERKLSTTNAELASMRLQLMEIADSNARMADQPPPVPPKPKTL